MLKTFEKVLCVVEPNAQSEAALIQAQRIADDNQAELAVVSILDTSKNLLNIFDNKTELKRTVEEAVSVKRSAVEVWLAQHEVVKPANVEVIAGLGFIEIIERVKTQNYDLVVKCANDVDWLDRLFGSDDMNLLRKCPCPVLMLKPEQSEIFRKVLATVDVNNDMSEQDNRVQQGLNEKVLALSANFSLSELTVLHVGSAWDALGEDFLRYSAFSQMPEYEVNEYAEQSGKACVQRLDGLMESMKKRVGEEAFGYLQPELHLQKGLASEKIPQMVARLDIDLVVMGTVARTGIPGFLIGNTAESILEQVKCSVLAVKPDSFV